MPPPTELCILCEKYKTDKCLKYRHNYSPYYYEILSPYRSVFKNILEIGIGYPGKPGSGVMEHVAPLGYEKGASLKVWKEFFPSADIWGIDICQEALFEDERIHTLLINQIDQKAIDSSFHDKKFDLIIDDGSHLINDQIASFCFLEKYLTPGGIYIIEDINPGAWVEDRIQLFFSKVKEDYKFTKVSTHDIRKDTDYAVSDDIFFVLQK